jgi:hypothetical protein
MKSFEQCCEAVRNFALAHPDAKEVAITDADMYGAGLGVDVVVEKMKGIERYARRYGINLFVCNASTLTDRIPVLEVK